MTLLYFAAVRDQANRLALVAHLAWAGRVSGLSTSAGEPSSKAVMRTVGVRGRVVWAAVRNLCRVVG